MTKIKLYPNDTTISEDDKWVGTDGNNFDFTKNFTIAAVGAYINALGVETVSTTDGTFINLTPNTATIGDVVVTADLSATGTPSANTFLRGDNTWATPVDTNTTYDLASSQNASNVNIYLTGSNATTDTVTLVAGTNITLTDDGSNNVTIASSGGGDATTYTFASGQPISSEVNLTLAHIDEDGVTLLGTNTVKLRAGTGINVNDNGSNVVDIINIFTDSPLELIDEGNGDGIVLAGRTAANYGNVGNKAVDLSISTGPSSTLGATGEYSFASGFGATASGLYSVAFNGTATGNSAVALGRSTEATQTGASALGYFAKATNLNSIAVGVSVSSASSSIAIGTMDPAKGATDIRAIAIGSGSHASSNDSIAIGQQNTASADYAVALGNNASATGLQSTAIGRLSSATHTAATALGSGATTTADDQIALGSSSGTVAILIASLPNTTSYADDAAAALGGVQIGELYRTGSIIKVRVS